MFEPVLDLSPARLSARPVLSYYPIDALLADHLIIITSIIVVFEVVLCCLRRLCLRLLESSSSSLSS